MSTRAFHPHRNYIAAVVLGTALSAFGSDRLGAAETPGQYVNDIGRYCTTCWRNARLPVDAWGDCTQEVFTRLLRRSPGRKMGWPFKARGKSVSSSFAPLMRSRNVPSGGRVSPVRSMERPIRVRTTSGVWWRTASKFASPPVNCSARRQQRILQLSFEGWSIPEIGEELSLPVERVSDEKYKAVAENFAPSWERGPLEIAAWRRHGAFTPEPLA